MRRILIIGIGAGHPDYLTVQAIEALNKADAFFFPDKGAEKNDLRKLRKDICERFVKNSRYRSVTIKIPQRMTQNTTYRGSVDAWHARLEADYEDAITRHLADGECGAFLVWGDPTLYDSTLRIIENIHARGLALEYEVIPGITAVQALAARHRIPLNQIGAPVLITTGRKTADGIPDDIGDVVVMLDGDQAFQRAEFADWQIYWGACLGTEDEILVSGKLADVSDEITTARQQKRAEKGWIMDTYLLRRTAKPR